MSRLVLFISIAASTFVIGVWGSRGFPIRLFSPAAVPLQATVNTTFGDDSSQKRRDRQVQDVLNDPENAKRHPQRMDTLQAATGYALSPCDKTMKTNLVESLRVYATGFNDMRRCNVMFANCDPVFEKATATYSTPLDKRVQAALHEAFEKGGISKNDFPPAIGMAVMTLANSQGSPVSACATTSARGP